MKSLVFAAVVMMASACWGQQPEYKGPERIPAGLKCTAWNGNYCLEVSPIAQPAPLKCGKWEHVEAEESQMNQDCFSADVPKGYCRAWKVIMKPGRCAPTMHIVTEKEFQEIMARLKKLEANK